MREGRGSSAQAEVSTPSIVDEFERRVRERPEATAVSGGLRPLTYAALDAESDALARRIASHGLRREARVAFQLRRGPRQVVTMLAILKARCAYVALDPGYPVARRVFLLDDAGCSLLITDDRSVEPELVGGRTHLALDEAVDVPSDVELPETDCRDLAYCMYTSGSTGQPKGVLVEHRGVVLLARSLASFYAGYDIQRHYQFFSLGFDASVWETFFVLLNGLELHIDERGPKQLPPDEILDLLDAARVDCLMTTPSFLARATPRARTTLRTITVCGEACSLELARAWSQHHAFVNAYGPTENTVGATMSQVDGTAAVMSIGRPLEHVDVLVLDEDAAVERGLVGEIVLAGPSVARGYHERPTQTASAFVSDRLSRWAPGTMYRTGDLGRELPGGEYEFLGRIDEQVKVRGFRVEPSEIEVEVRRDPSVLDAVVVAFGDQSSRSLAAFVRCEGAFDADATRARLAQALPPHMVPLVLTQIDELPMNASGKTDRSALRELAESATEIDAQPSSGVDADAEQITAVWRAALGREDVHPDDDFFALGGHSALAGEVTAQVRALVSRDVPLRLLFDHPTLGAYVSAARGWAEVDVVG